MTKVSIRPPPNSYLIGSSPKFSASQVTGSGKTRINLVWLQIVSAFGLHAQYYPYSLDPLYIINKFPFPLTTWVHFQLDSSFFSFSASVYTESPASCQRRFRMAWFRRWMESPLLHAPLLPQYQQPPPRLRRTSSNTTSQVAIVGSNVCPIESLDYEWACFYVDYTYCSVVLLLECCVRLWSNSCEFCLCLWITVDGL